MRDNKDIEHKSRVVRFKTTEEIIEEDDANHIQTKVSNRVIFILPPLSRTPSLQSYMQHLPKELLSVEEKEIYFLKTLGLAPRQLKIFESIQWHHVSRQNRIGKNKIFVVLRHLGFESSFASSNDGEHRLPHYIPSLKFIRTLFSIDDCTSVSELRYSSLSQKRNISVKNGEASSTFPRDISTTSVSIPQLLETITASHSANLSQNCGAMNMKNTHGYNNTLSQKKLSNDLTFSLMKFVSLSKRVREDIIQAQQLCRSEVGKHPNICRQLQKWSIQCFYNISENMTSSFLMASFLRWKEFLRYERQKENIVSHFQYRSLNMIWILICRRLWKRMAIGWTRWMEYVHVEQLTERMELERLMSHRIQMFWRMASAKNILLGLIHEKRVKHAIVIQSMSRAKEARKQLGVKLREKTKLDAIILLQSVFRCRKARKASSKLQLIQKQCRAIILLQKLLRGKIGRKYAAVVFEKKFHNDCATQIQKIIRGYIGKKRIMEYKLFLRQSKMSTLIQKRIRIKISKKKTQELRLRRKTEQERLELATLLVQRVYRGHHERALFVPRMTRYLDTLKKKNRAVTAIQCCWRKIKASTLVKEMKETQREKMIKDARLWKELWSEADNEWYYYNEETDTSAWKPPRTGYTKPTNNKLILQNGLMIDDPLYVLTEEQKLARIKEMACVDCEKAQATRYCEQCGDKYCTACYIIAHPKGGRRESHTFIRIGSMECEECGNNIAVRWCTSCDDPFCMECWDKIHTRGNRRLLHKYCSIDTDGNVSPRQWEADGREAGIYSFSQSNENEYFHDDKKWYEGGGYYGGEEGRQMHYPWSVYYDGNQVPYYYNSETGECTYKAPISDSASNNGSGNNFKFRKLQTFDKTKLSRLLKKKLNVEKKMQWAMDIKERERIKEKVLHPLQEALGLKKQSNKSDSVTSSVSQNLTSWEPLYDSAGQVYYYNQTSGESTYDPYYRLQEEEVEVEREGISNFVNKIKGAIIQK